MYYAVLWQHTVSSLQRELSIKILEFICTSKKNHSFKIN